MVFLIAAKVLILGGCFMQKVIYNFNKMIFHTSHTQWLESSHRALLKSSYGLFYQTFTWRKLLFD